MLRSLLFLNLLFLTVPVLAQSGRFSRPEAIQSFFSRKANPNKPLLLAHRGGPDPDETENSLQTFTQTYRQLPEAILEMDVRMTADSVLTLLHDDELERTTTGTGSLKAKTWKELSQLPLRTLAGKPTRQKMPLFEAVLRWNANRAVLALDVKPGVDLTRVLRMVERHRALNSVFVICYTVDDARKLRQQYPALWLALGFTTTADLEKLRQAGFPLKNLIALAPRQLQPGEFYEAFRRAGIPVSVGTYGAGNPDEQPMTTAEALYRQYARQGADILTTDRPLAVAALFEEKN
ncbi:glycerophosphodiester phosphodiesterase family protein [Tellurirhabdus rosea]|uniref:glycerophosphodiester phosphodiesterase family protein n=1 Tax=Tellurirhabdus rosea TaxID=2674997 RepID=UPI00225AF9AD|nr:glycerophosphodiester phosphodiesterase family protein [Tellurirhabdus rosea]